MHPANSDSILAFDVGLKRTGVAVGSFASGSAQAVATLPVTRGQPDWSQLESLLTQWEPKICVVGDPNTSDPHLNKVIARLVHRLQQGKIKVVRVDEKLTTVRANTELAARELNVRKKAELRDQVAACLILESYLEQAAESP